jgi:hypothetical protein
MEAVGKRRKKRKEAECLRGVPWGASKTLAPSYPPPPPHLADDQLDVLDGVAHRDAERAAGDEEADDGVELHGEVAAHALAGRRRVVLDDLWAFQGGGGLEGCEG